MTATFKILSALQSYPRAELKEAVGDFAKMLADDGLIDPAPLGPLIERLATTDLLDLQQDYVALFDTNKSLSLHLFEHIHGESRDRGQAMVDLDAHYRFHGLELTARELPDYLPLFLEFLSVLPQSEALALFGEVRHVIVALGARLDRRESPYAGIFACLITLCPAVPNPSELVLATKDEDGDAASRDAEWEEAEILFGPANEPGAEDADCPKIEDMLADIKSAPAAEKSGSLG